jgi:ERCC4-related helicase
MHPVEATPDQLELHKAYLTAHRHQLTLATHKNGPNAQTLRLIVPLIQVANGAKDSNKIIKVRKLVEQAVGKVVIFCHYVASARLVTDYLTEYLGTDSITRLYATDPLATPTSLSQEQQVDRRTKFQYDPNIKAGVFSLNLASQSIDLTAASDVIYYCCGWSSLSILQSLKRAVRPGNPNKEVNTHYIYTNGLIDTHQVALAVEKIRGSKLLMDFDLDDLDGDPDNNGGDLSPAEAVRRLLGS